MFRTISNRLTRRRTEALKISEIRKSIAIAVQYIRSNPGDIAEFGVHSGQYATITCRELAAYSQNRTLHLFDSFKGYPPLTKDDASTESMQSTPYPQSAPDLLKRLKRIYPHVKIYPGFFTDAFLSPNLSMITLDANLYSSTKTVLDGLLNAGCINQGAVILFGGWNLSRANPKEMAKRAWYEAVEKYSIDYSDEGRFGAKGAYFIIHSYSP